MAGAVFDRRHGGVMDRRAPVRQPAGVRPWLWAGLVFAAVLLAYLSRLLLTGQPYLGGGGDTIPTRLLPVSLLRENNFDLDEFAELRAGPELPYYACAIGGHMWSKYPVGGPLLLVPAYAALQAVGVDVCGDAATRNRAAGAFAAIFSALSVLVVFRTYAPRGAGRALAVAGLYAFGTGVWPTCAQDLWQHTFGVLFLALCVLCLERGAGDDRWLGWMGLPAGLLFLVRPGNGLLVAILGWAVLRRRPTRLIFFAVLGLPFLAFTLGYNLSVFGHLFGGYAVEASCLRPWDYFAEGLAGLLVSPSHGLLVYSPVLLLGTAARRSDADPDARFVCRTLALLLIGHLLLFSSYVCWDGGYCFGPRLLLEVMPAAAGLLWHAWPRLTAGRAWRAALVVLGIWSVWANGVGYVFGWYDWCAHPAVDRCPGRLWDWRDNPLACAVWGLPDRCPHPLQRGGEHFDVDGVEFEQGRGWAYAPGQLLVVGREAELLVECHGLPAGMVVLSLQAEPGPDRQEVIAHVDGEERARAVLSGTTPTRLVVRLRPEERRRPARLALNFSACRRDSVLDIRPFAGAVLGVYVGFYER
jgi:hypothetical protein